MKKIISLLLVFVLAFSVLTINASAAEEKNMNIYGLYLTLEGDATLIESDGEWLLVDTGIEGASDELLKKLSYYGVKKMDVLLSHLHADHMGGLAALEDSGIKINKLYLPDSSTTPLYPHTETFRKRAVNSAQANNSSVTIKYLKKGSIFSFGDVSAKVLGPVAADISPEDFEQTNEQTPMDHYVNCRSLTVRFDCGETSYITAGDIEKEEEEALLKAYKGTDELDADIMKLSHHALYTSNTAEFLAKITPKYSFGQNSEKGITEGFPYRMYYSSCENASKYGPVYLVGDEKKDFAAKVTDGKISIYRGTEKLSGLVTLTGGDGTVVKTDKYYITGGDVKEGVYTVDGKKYYISDGGFVNKAFYSFNLDKYVYRYEPVENGDVRYFDLEGVMYTGFRKINDNYFYFNTSTGVMVKGDKDFTPVKIGSNKYAINENGAVYNYNAASGAWKQYGSNYRYFDKNGVMQTGWVTVEGKKYYLEPSTGLRKIGLSEIDGKKYYFVEENNAGYAWCEGWKKFGAQYRYFGSDGVMCTGFRKINDNYFYFDTSTGIMVTGDKDFTPVKIGSKKYAINENGAVYNYGKSSGAWKKYGSNYRYFDKKGVMKTGWVTVGSKKYYLNTSTGLRTIGLKKIDGKTYYFVEKNNAGYVYKSGWKKFGSKYRYFDKDGVMKTGWLTIGKKKYYLSKSTGYRSVGLKEIGGKTYYFVEKNNAGYVYKSGWKKFGSKYRYFDKDGVMKTGWLTVGGNKYYLSKSTGYRSVGLKKISGKTYYFVEKNKAAYMYKSGWKKFGSKYRYFDSKGVMKTGWVKVKGKYYYLNKSTGYRSVGLKKIGKKTYYFVEKNKAAYRYSGWKKFGSKKRYFDKNGVMATGKKKIGGKTYKFDKKGYLKK